MALLAYLAVTGGRHHRESLATLLWPESACSSAQSALRNLLWFLRTTPVASVLRSDRNTVELEAGGELTVDANQFRALVARCPSRSHRPDAVCAECAPLLEEAVGLWQGAFMSGYVAAHSAQFDDWQVTEGEALHRERCDALRRLTDHHRATGDWAASARHARDWLDEDPLSEAACRRLMHSLHACGRRSEALQVFEECARRLQSELGVEPEGSTTDLADRIRREKTASIPTGDRRSSRLPPGPPRIIGRGEVSGHVERLLTDGAAQAVCLVGLGGTGKTALALHVAGRIENRFAQGAAFVALDSPGASAFPAAAIRDVLGLSSDAGANLPDESLLADGLRGHEILLVLDGVEERLSEVSALVGALRASAGVRVLLTSRIEMEDSGVVTVPIHGLECPPPDAPLASVAGFDAVRLLRMTAEQHGLVLVMDDDELRGMARLARLLDGSPLGLEMAAGWRSILTWDSVADRVCEGLGFLVHRDRSVAPKHRTLAALFEHAWSSLAGEERAALRRLSVFRGEFTIQAAEDVAETNPGALATLVGRCLLIRSGPDRFRMHELLRQFAAKRLTDESSDEARARARHMSYYTAAVRRWQEDLKGPDQFPTLLRMEGELENVRVAFAAAASAGLADQLRDACEGLFIYYTMRTRLVDGESLFAGALHAYREHAKRDPIVEGFLSIVAGWFASWDRTDIATARRTEGLALLPDAEPQDRLHALANVVYAYACFGRERERNLERLARTIAFFEKAGDPWGVASTLDACGAVEERWNEAASQRFVERSIQLYREIADSWSEGPATFRLARLSESRGDFSLALSQYEEAQRLNEAYTSHAFGVVSALLGRARATRKLGDARGCRALAEEALQLGRKTGYRFQIARSLLELARASRMERDFEGARRRAEEAFALLARLRWRDLQAECAGELVRIAIDEEDPGSAERWLQEVRLLEPHGADLPTLKAELEKLRAG